MATISPSSPNSAPSAVPPASATPPQPSSSSPAQSILVAQPDANPPESSTPATPPPVVSSPPTTPSAPPPSPLASSPPTPTTAQPPPTNATPPLPSAVSPPLPPPPVIDPPVSSRSPPPTESPPPPLPPNSPSSTPPPSPLPNPPTNSPPTPLSSPPTSFPSPPSSNPPRQLPPPSPSSDPPVGSPPPPSSTPPENSPPPPASQAPESPLSPSATRPPSSSPPSSSSSPPPSDPVSASPPYITPATPTPISHNSSSSSRSPPPGSQTTVPPSPSLPTDNSNSDAPQTASAPGSGGIGSGRAIGIGVVAGILMLGLIGLVAFWIYKRKKRTSGANGGYIIPASLGSSPRSDAKLLVKKEYSAPLFVGGSGSDTPTGHGGYNHSKSWFTYKELSEATSGFSQQNLLGEGGFGFVYKGILKDGREVAVKQLKVGGGQGEREFQAEVEIISRIHHRHLVSLVGYCIWESKKLLVYDYVPNGTLHFYLHGEGRAVMDWATRVKIAAGAARGIAYLHEDCNPRIIHRDIKSSNILLDNNFEARVSDFGLAKLAMDADTHVTTRVMGTFGYLAPEYATSGKLTEKSDVYSFGVVLLELITGRKPVDESQPLGDESLVAWARPLLSHAFDTGEYEGLVDPKLEKNYIESEMFRMIEAAAVCVRHSAAKRPRMGQVARVFDSISDFGDLSNGLRFGESQLYNAAQQSAELRWLRRVAFGSQDISSDFFSLSKTQNNLGFWSQSGQGGDVSGQHGQNMDNVGFSSQSVQNVNISVEGGQPGVGGDGSRQQSQNAYGSNQHIRNLNFYREDSLNR